MNNSLFNFQIFQLDPNEGEDLKIDGKNQKKVFILYQDPEEQLELRQFLAKVLQAIQIDLDQDTLFINNKHGQKCAASDFIKKYSPQFFLLFGIDPKSIGIQFQLPAYHWIQHQETRFLRADAVAKIYEERQNGGKEMSAKLWRALKEISN